MELGETLKRQQLEIAKVAVRQQVRQHVAAMVIPCAGRRTRILAGDYLERGIGRIAGEIFVGIDIEIARMIDRQQTYAVQIDNFFHRLHQAEAELAIFLFYGVAIDFDVLGRPGNVALARPDPVADHARAEHVRDQLVMTAVPHKERWT